MMRWFEDVTGRVGTVQIETLRRILESNWGVEYLDRWFGPGIRIEEVEPTALESLYTSLVPLASHANFEHYFQRIADGDRAPILTRQPIELLSLSSGTTEGRQKFVPFTWHSARTTLQTFRLAAAYRSRVYPIREGGRILEFIYGSKQFKTKGGLTAGTATTHYYSSEEFKIKQMRTKSFTCSPEAVISGGDYRQSTYCHLLLGLLFSENIEFITSTFAYTIVQAFRALEEQWRDVVRDLGDGSLSQTITVGPMRASVLEILGSPRPALAKAIEAKCEELAGRDWTGLVPTLWPNAKYIYSIMTGSMQHYLTKLRHYSGDLPLVSADYGSTESWIGVNIDSAAPPEKVTFAVVPTFSYFEFIPLHRQRSSHGQNGCRFAAPVDDFVEGEPVPLSRVRVGQEYEVVLTTFTGLYRYRLGDVVEVVGFHNGTPKLSFICRRKLILTINIDKNTEKDLQLVVDKGSERLRKARGELVDFTSHADVGKQPGHYVIYWEIRGDVDEDVLRECCREMDNSFADHGYVVSRKSNSIGPLELRIVESGTFKKILDYFIANGAGLSQFKTPRCTNDPVLLSILNVCTINRFHSTAYTAD
ncbi:hypothetical protein CRG98_026665 [Punica granatum]|nr:hypothetical protein CRG98_026665 [Punica granatum]